MDAFLIDVETIKELGYVNKSVDAEMVSVTLRRVQDSMLMPILGTSFYDRLQTGVDDNDLTADETSLLQNYITPFLVAAVDFRIINPLTYEIRSKTVGLARDEHITPISMAENNLIKDDLSKDCEVYRTRLIGYLKDNCTLFTTYNEYLCSFENVAPDTGETRTRIRFI